jgi:sucrose-6-phosphate hydrolase SacC (GH32 family)
VEKRYLNLPVRAGAGMREVTVSVDGVVQRSFTMELAERDPEWWAFLDLAPFHGRTIVVAADGTADGVDAAAALENVHQADQIVADETTYRETRRPQLRFSSRRGWINDPNGLVFYEGEYHLFYQHSPYTRALTSMHWGHAVSRDLVHWEELPIALYPDETGNVFSGSAVVDWDDTAGFRVGPDPALVAIYTAATRSTTQGIAVSLDRGRTWQKYAGNPVLDGISPFSRDPKVFWYEPDGKWVMAIYLDELDLEAHSEVTLELIESYHPVNRYGLFSSSDLKQWQKMSEFPISLLDDSECPDLFEIPFEESAGETRWIFLGAAGRYLVGNFDGERFVIESGPHHLHRGNSFYASQTFSDIPASDGRRVLIHFGPVDHFEPADASRGPVYAGMPFNQAMGLPLELTLRTTADGPRLFANPVRELQKLRHTTTRIEPQSLRPGEDPLAALRGELWEIEADISAGTATKIVVEVRGLPVVYDVDRRELSCLEKTAPLELVDGRVRLRIFVDRTTVDVFGGDGRLFMPMASNLTDGSPSLSLRAEGGEAHIHALDVHELASVWT